MSIKFDCKIKGLDSLEKKLNKIIKELPYTMSESVEEVLKNIQGYAIRLEKGHNENGIVCEMIDTSSKEIKGRVVAKPEEFMTDSNISYLWFEYFGTRRICRTKSYRKNKTLYRKRIC